MAALLLLAAVALISISSGNSDDGDDVGVWFYEDDYVLVEWMGGDVYRFTAKGDNFDKWGVFGGGPGDYYEESVLIITLDVPHIRLYCYQTAGPRLDPHYNMTVGNDPWFEPAI